MIAAQTSQGDLPALLDILTVAVTTLDAFGLDGYSELYLYVVGTAAGEIARDLRIEDGHLNVGPPTSALTFPPFIDHDFEANRRALLLADLCYILKTWKWSAAGMARYLRCSQAMLATWIGRSSGIDVPAVPRPVVERIKRLSMIDQTMFLLGIPDRDRPAWLSRKRSCFSQRSVQSMLLGGDPCEFAQVLMWALNSAPRTAMVH